MGRIIAFDIGQKRTGIAVTDELKIIVQPLETIATPDLFPFIFEYFKSEPIEKAIVGYPLNLDGTATHNTERVDKFIKRFQRLFPDIPLEQIDEAYTSKQAVQTMIAAGVKQKDRRKKENIDKVAAAIILQEYMDSQAM